MHKWKGKGKGILRFRALSLKPSKQRSKQYSNGSGLDAVMIVDAP